MTNLFNLIIHLNNLLQEIKFQLHLLCQINNNLVVHILILRCSQVLMFHKYPVTMDNSMLVVMDNHKWEDTDSHQILMDNNQWDMVSNQWDMDSSQWDTVSNQWDMDSNQWDTASNQINLISLLILRLKQANFITCHHHNNHQSERF